MGLGVCLIEQLLEGRRIDSLLRHVALVRRLRGRDDGEILESIKLGTLVGGDTLLGQLGPAAVLVGQGVSILTSLEVSRVLIMGVTFDQWSIPATQLTFWWLTLLALVLILGCVSALVVNTIVVVTNLDSVQH